MRAGRSSPLFDPAWYLSHHPHVVEAGLARPSNVSSGSVEGLDPGPDFSADDYLRGRRTSPSPRDHPLVHYLSTR